MVIENLVLGTRCTVLEIRDSYKDFDGNRYKKERRVVSPTFYTTELNDAREDAQAWIDSHMPDQFTPAGGGRCYFTIRIEYLREYTTQKWGY